MTCYNPSPSSHISPWCLTEACDIVLIFTLLFSIKGQTVQNSTVIPHTLCSHLTQSSSYFLQTVYHVTAQLLTRGFWRRSCDNASLHYIYLILYVTESCGHALTSALFPPRPKTANQKAASRAGRLSGEGGNPDVAAGRQCKFVDSKKRCLNRRLICMTTPLSGSFCGKHCLSKLCKEYKSLRHPLIPFLRVWSHLGVYLGFCLFDFVGACVCVFQRQDVFRFRVCVSAVQRGLSLCFCLSRWGFRENRSLS